MLKPETVHEKNTLTPRELEVLKVIKIGHTANKEIANGLDIKVWTVKNHLTSIYDKLRISGGSGAGIKKFKALRKAILLGVIEEFQPSINQEETPIFQLGAFNFFINTLTELHSISSQEEIPDTAP